ncbi:MAG: hypothetical protein ACXWNQ_10025, partial [Anaerolineales bacterium]
MPAEGAGVLPAERRHWVVVISLVEMPSATHTLPCVGKTTTNIRGGLFFSASNVEIWMSDP